MEVPLQVSEDRIAMRWEHAMEQAEKDKSHLGGRWVPKSFAKELFDTEHGCSRSQDVSEQMALQFENVKNFSRYYTTQAEHASSLRQNRKAEPSLEACKYRAQPGQPLQETTEIASLLAASFPISPTQIASTPKPQQVSAPKISRPGPLKTTA